MQNDLFSKSKPQSKPGTLGETKVAYRQASTILNKSTGFMDGYDYTLNPYSGCFFGCTYCYAAFFARDKEKMDNWGYWVEVKENALTLLRKKRKSSIEGKTIYMSSVTDPYQPIEKKLELTRGILEILLHHQPHLVIQTRSPLVTRDIDLLKKFNFVQVNMTVTTDSEEVRKVFEPQCPKNSVRLKAIKEVNDSGIQSVITMTPLLPVLDVEKFLDQLLNTGVKHFITQPFHADRGKFVAGTREGAMQLIDKYDWTREKYLKVEQYLKKKLPDMGVGKDGFTPLF
ncbi:MAG: radical SAM protein [Balneolaceae bacterium]|nr:radical SAM protein [Balneolaceae bacterium]